MLKGVVGGGGSGGSGTGNVVGPSSATDQAIAIFSGVTGKAITELPGGLFNPVYSGPSGSKIAHASIVLTDVGIGGTFTRPSALPTGSWCANDFINTTTPSSDQSVADSNTFLKYVLRSTGTKAIGLLTGFDVVINHGSSGQLLGAANGMSLTVQNVAATTAANLVGATMIVRGTDPAGINNVVVGMQIDPNGDGAPSIATSYGTWRGLQLSGMNMSGSSGSGTNAIGAVTKREALYIGTMAGTATTDKAICVDATQASTFAGAIQIGASAAGTQFSVRQDASLVSFTDSSGASANTVSVNQGVLSAISSASLAYAATGDISMALSGNPAVYTIYGVNGIGSIASGDSSTQNAATVFGGGNFVGTYIGSGAGANAVGINAGVTKAGAGTLSGMTSVNAAVSFTAGSSGGNVGTIAPLSTQVSFANAGTLTVTNLKLLNLPRPTGNANVTLTNVIGADFGNLTPAAIAAVTNAPIVIRLQNQTGTGSIVLQQLGTTVANNKIEWASQFTRYSNVVTAGDGIAYIVGYGRATGQSAANASIATYTLAAADGTFRVSGNVNVTAATAISTTLTCTYTDESNTARTMILPVQQVAGNFIAGGLITGTGAWETPAMHIRCKASTTITILTAAGTFTGVTYTAEGVIEKMAS